MTGLSVTRPYGADVLASLWRHFAQWWGSELRVLVPSAWRRLFNGKAMPDVFIWPEGDAVNCRFWADGSVAQKQFPAAGFDLLQLQAWLDEVGFGRDQVRLGPMLARELFLRRDLCVPREALASLPQILDQEITHRTPFQPCEIWHGAHRLSDASRQDVAVLHHWIIPRDRAAAATASIGIPVDEFDFLGTRIEGGEPISVVLLRAAPPAVAPWASRAIRLLAGALMGITILGLVAFEWRQASVATELEAALVEAKAGVQGGDSRSAQLTRLYAMKSDAGWLAIWDELSLILPEDTFLTDIRMAEGRITISGYSAQAARLVRIIDRSSMFSGATLIAAIVPDANEGKDRFRIGFRLRNGQLAPASKLFRKSET